MGRNMPKHIEPPQWLISEWEEGRNIYSYADGEESYIRISKDGNEYRAYRYFLNHKEMWSVSVDLRAGTRIVELLNYIRGVGDHA